MKSSALLVVTLASAAMLAGCDNMFGLDNFDEPNATLTGRVVYNGEPVGVRSGGVELELWQPGYELNQKIPVHVAQDGSFSASLFNGSYKLIPVRGNGPWVNTTDTLTVNVSGATSVDFPVTPYYTITNASVSYNGGVNAPAGAIQATFGINAVAGGADVEYAALYVSTTNFVDRTNRVAGVEQTPTQLGGIAGTKSLTVNLPANIRLTPSPEPRTEVQARIGLKIAGVSEMIFTPVFEVGI